MTSEETLKSTQPALVVVVSVLRRPKVARGKPESPRSINWDTNAAGMSNVAAAIVFGGSGRDVTDVMTGGRWVVRERKLQSLDAEALGHDLDRVAAELIRRTG